MKGLLGLLALCVVAQSAVTSYKEGREYKYDYKAHSLSSIPLSSNDRSGFSIWAKVHLLVNSEQEIVLKLEAPEVRQMSIERVDDDKRRESMLRIPELHEIDPKVYSELPSDVKERVESQLVKPIIFSIDRQSRLVKDIRATAEEPEWSLNIKRAIINKFQLQRISESAEQKTEDSIIGEECKINYDVISRESSDADRKTVSKTYSLDQCKTVSQFRDVIGFQGRREEKREDIAKSTFVSKYEVIEENRKYFINSAVSESRFTLTPFSPKEGEMTVYSRQELKFEAETEKSIEIPRDLVKRSETLFKHLQREDNQYSDVYTDIISETEKVELIKKLVQEVIEEPENKEEVEHKSTEKIFHVNKLMRSLSKTNSFVEIVRFSLEPQRAEKARPLTVSSLAFCGSPALVEALPLIREHLTDKELTRIVSALPTTHVPTQNTLKAIKNMYLTVKDESAKRQLLLTLGAQIHDLCKTIEEGQFKPSEQCDYLVRSTYKQFLSNEYRTAPTETKKLTVLKTIGNSGLDMTDLLKTLIQDVEVATQVRENAVYALRRISEHEKIQNILLPVYKNEKKLYPVELRIAAFNVLIERIPTEEMLHKLVAPLNEEENRQVGNYVYSYLKNLIDLPTIYAPTERLTKTAQNLLPTIERFEDGLWYSKNMQYIICSVSQKMAHFIEVNMINTPSQSMPRSLNLKLARSFGGYYMNIAEAGFRIEGLDNLIKQWVSSIQPSSDFIKTLVGDRFHREIVHIQSILNEDDIKDKKIEETRGYLFLKHLGNEIGFITTEDYTLSELKDRLVSLSTLEDSSRYLTVQPLAQATLKVQSLIGMPVVVDWSAISIASIKSERTEEKDAIVARDITPRLFVKFSAKVGVDLGLIKSSVGQRMHLDAVTPLSVRVTKGDKRVELEAHIKTERDQSEPRRRIIELKSVPVKVTEILHVKDNSYKIESRDLQIPELLQSSKYEAEYEGLSLKTESQSHDNTVKLPHFPLDGRHSLKLEWVSEPKPMGIRAELSYDLEQYKYTALIKLNPKIESIKREINTVVAFKTEDVRRPRVEIEVEPKWQAKIYRAFVSVERVSGQINPSMSYIEAAEDKPVELILRAQWGENKEYKKDQEDLIVKMTAKKSELQKKFEIEDNKIESSDCSKCEESKDKYRNIFCDRCIYKRSMLTRLDSKTFVDKEKMSYLEYTVLPVLTYYGFPYYRMLDSKLWSSVEKPTDLQSTEQTLLTSSMAHLVRSDKLIALRTIHDVHPYFTEHNLTVLYEDKKVVFTRMPLITANRRIYNLPNNRLTDVFTDRITLPNYGKCSVDALDKVHTLDTVVYDLPAKTECEQVLIKDCTKERKLEITTRQSADKKRSLKVKLEDKLIEVKPVSDSFEVRVNDKVMPWVNDKIENEHVRVERSPVKTPQGDIKHILKLTIIKERIDTELYHDLVSVKLPFWHKNRVCGLCGDFNGEPKEEFQLPSQKPAETLQHFISAYSDKQCRQ